MSQFQYKSVTHEGVVLDGEMEARNASDVARQIQAEGAILIRVQAKEPARPAATAAPRKRWQARKAQVQAGDVLNLTENLATLLEADVPLDNALKIAAQAEPNGAAAEVLQSLHDAVQGGQALSDALRAFPQVFSPLYVSSVSVGEQSGTLPASFRRMVEYLEHRRDTQAQVVQAMTYPAILFVVSIISVLTILTLVIPQFQSMFEDGWQHLPWSTKMVLGASEAVSAHGWLFAVAIAGFAVAVRQGLRSTRNRLRLDGWLLRLPVVGAWLSALDIARFTRTLGISLQGGVPILGAFELANSTLQNQQLRLELSHIGQRLKGGARPGEELEQCVHFPRLAARMVRVGEESGQLDSMLMKVASRLDGEVLQSTRRLIALLEPILIVTMGVLIGGMVIALLAGIMSINSMAL